MLPIIIFGLVIFVLVAWFVCWLCYEWGYATAGKDRLKASREKLAKAEKEAELENKLKDALRAEFKAEKEALFDSLYAKLRGQDDFLTDCKTYLEKAVAQIQRQQKPKRRNRNARS